MVLSRKFWIVLSTVFIVAAAFGFYLLVYVKERESELKEKKFRALEQYSINIKESYKESSKKILVQQSKDSIKLSIREAEIDRIVLEKLQKTRTDSINLTIEQKEFDNLKKFKLDSIHKALFKAKQEIANRLSNDVSFDELLVQSDTSIIFQTFRNTLGNNDLERLLKIDTTVTIKRVGTFTINDRDYHLFMHQFQLSDWPGHHEQWRIYGFSLKDSFQQQTRSVELILVLFISLILIIILIAMPLLKLWVMNEIEELKMMNIWLTGFSVIVGSSFMLQMVLLSSDFIDDLNLENSDQGCKSNSLIFDRDSRLEALSCAVQDQFSRELRAIYDQLVDIHKNPGSWFISWDSPKQGKILENKDLSGYFSGYCYFNETLWINKDGVMDAVLATHEIDPHDPDLNVNLSERKYFSWVKHDSTWSLPDRLSRPGERISLQSIHSYRSGSHEAGIGIPWNSDGALAMATRLTSVMDPLLPPGYQFCIFDGSGMVWFHSTTEKNLQENFLDETNHASKLQAALNGRLDVHLDLKYDYKNFRTHVTPIRNMDLFLVTMHDTEYYKSPIVLTAGFTLIMIFLMLFIQGIHQVILYACSVQTTQLRRKIFFLGWLRPRNRHMFLYEKSVATQLILLIVFGLLINLNDGRFLMICFLSLPVYLTTYHYLQLEGNKLLEEKKQVNPLALLREPLFIASVILVIIINLIGLYFTDDEGIVKIVLVHLVVVGCLIASWLTSYGNFYSKAKLKISHFLGYVFRYFNIRFNYNPYVWFLFLWLMLVAVLPTYYFYKTGYYEQSSAWARYIQLESAKAQVARETILENKLSETFDKQDLKEIISMGNYLNATTEIVPTLKLNCDFTLIPDNRVYELVFHGSPVITGQVELSRSALFPTSYDRAWTWLEDKGEEGRSVALHYTTKDGESKYYVSTHEDYGFLKGKYWPISISVLLLGIFGVYKMLIFCIKHIFGVGLLSSGSLKEIHIEPGVRHFIVGLPYSGKNRLIKKIKKKFVPHKVKVLDLRKDADIIFPESFSLIILKHFEAGINDHNLNEKKLNIFNKLQDLPKVSVICLSNMEPQGILEFYDKQANYYSKVKHDQELDGLYRKCSQALRHWKNVLSGYKVHYKALEQGHAFSNPFIAEELDHGEFLPSLKTHIRLKTGDRQEREEKVLQVEEMSQNYYHSLWNSFCNNEKFVLYDLAKDGFVNMRNMKMIRILRQKGVVEFEDSLRIMNASFNNFILSVVNEDEEMKMERQMHGKGSWNTLHLVLVITVISSIVFLGIAQQELVKNFQAILAALVTLLPLLARFSGVFESSKGKD